jgi:hypothetical protein
MSLGEPLMWCLCCIPAHVLELITGQVKDGVTVAEYQCPHSGRICDYRERRGIRELSMHQEFTEMDMYKGQRRDDVALSQEGGEG